MTVSYEQWIGNGGYRVEAESVVELIALIEMLKQQPDHTVLTDTHPHTRPGDN